MKNVYDRQDKIIENRDKLEELLVRAHVEAEKAWELGATEERNERHFDGYPSCTMALGLCSSKPWRFFPFTG